MKEQRIANAERLERSDELEVRIRLEVDGALHRHLCCKGMDASVSEALELLAEGFAVARAAAEPLEDLRAFLAEHGLHVPVANGANAALDMTVNKLGAADQARAQQLRAAPNPPSFWFRPEYNSIEAIMQLCAVPIYRLYRFFLVPRTVDLQGNLCLMMIRIRKYRAARTPAKHFQSNRRFNAIAD